MTLELSIQCVERTEILDVRARVLSLPGASVSLLSGDRMAMTRHWAAYLGEQVVGCVSVMPLRGWALRGMAVLPEHRRQGIGARLLDTVYAEVHKPMWCNARLEVVTFYSHLGWCPVGPVFHMANQRPHQRMTWTPTDESP